MTFEHFMFHALDIDRNQVQFAFGKMLASTSFKVTQGTQQMGDRTAAAALPMRNGLRHDAADLGVLKDLQV
jgi:hypothetical protein